MSTPAQNPRDGAAREVPESPWALNIGRVSGIPIRLHFTFLLLLAWIGFTAYGAEGRAGLVAVLYVIGIFACVVLHELGHSLVAQRYGIGVSEIVLYPIGGIARLEKFPKPAQELWIAQAGPAVNVVIAIVIFALLRISGRPEPLQDMSLQIGDWWGNLLKANIYLVLFNMLPAFPMDGGRVLRALLALRIGELRATQIAAAIGQLLAIGVAFVGMFGLPFISFPPNPFLLFIAFFVFLGAGSEAGMYRNRALVQDMPVSAAMITDFRTLPAGATLEDAKELLLATHQSDFPVVHGDEVIGLLSRQALLRGLAQQGPTAYVNGVMSRDFVSAAPEADLQEVASELQASPQFCVLVIENGRLLGMVTPENLAELLVLRQLAARRDVMPPRDSPGSH